MDRVVPLPSRCVLLHYILGAFSLSIFCRYADESGTTLLGPDGQTNVAIAEYIGSGDLLGLEELHIFFEIAWFDKGSWAWGQYLAEWGTRGIFQVGTRRTRLPSGPRLSADHAEVSNITTQERHSL